MNAPNSHDSPCECLFLPNIEYEQTLEKASIYHYPATNTCFCVFMM